MKKFLLFVLFAIYSIFSYAQISFDQDSMKNTFVDPTNLDYSQKAYLTNSASNANDTIFNWEVIKVDQPSEWELTICTYGTCISNPALNEKYAFTLQVGEKEEFKLGWFIGEVSGTGLVTVAVSSKNFPEYKDTVTLEIATLASLEKVNQPTFSIFPNPVQDKMTIRLLNANYKTIEIYDLLGNKVLSQNVFSGESINMSDLNKGVYILRLKGSSSYSKVIQKN